MNLASPLGVAERFNESIGRADLEGLIVLMTEDHAFIDTSGAVLSGKAVTAAWSSFFSAFPGYRNEFARHRETADTVAIQGRSICTDPRLQGPALWRAKVRDGKIAEWQVYEDTAATRQA